MFIRASGSNAPPYEIRRPHIRRDPRQGRTQLPSHRSHGMHDSLFLATVGSLAERASPVSSSSTDTPRSGGCHTRLGWGPGSPQTCHPLFTNQTTGQPPRRGWFQTSPGVGAGLRPPKPAIHPFTNQNTRSNINVSRVKRDVQASQSDRYATGTNFGRHRGKPHLVLKPVANVKVRVLPGRRRGRCMDSSSPGCAAGKGDRSNSYMPSM